MSTIWKGRYQALYSSIDRLDTRVKKSKGFAGKLVLEKTLDSLQQFSESLFDFLHDGFYGSAAGNPHPACPPFLEQADAHSPESVISAVLSQVGYDLLTLERILGQRADWDPTNNPAHTALAKADALAYKALQPAVAKGWISQPGILTYFLKDDQIRVVPYAPVALIAVPYSIIETDSNGANTDRDFLAIPHEVAHYVFRHGQINGNRIEALCKGQMPAHTNWTRAWLEEVFADVYGSLVAGPVIGLSFQGMAYDDKPTKFVEDDGEHPVPFLRPFIYHDMAKRLDSTESQRAGKRLRRTWENKLKKRGNPKGFVPNHLNQAGQYLLVSKKEALKQLKQMTTIVLNCLGLDSDAIPYDDFDWWKNLTDAPEKIYLNNEETDPHLLFDELPASLNNAVKSVEPHKDDDKLDWQTGGKTGDSIDHLIEMRHCDGDTSKIPNPIWRAYMGTLDWMVGGPNENPVDPGNGP